MGGSLRHSLQELSVRCCCRLRTRSAYELLNFVHHVREVARDSSATAPLGGSLRLINGVDLEVLQVSGRSAGVAGRTTGPPMLLRTFVAPEGGGRRPPGPQFAALSECDIHFFASMLHLFSHIPFCHLHIVVPSESASTVGSKDALMQWGRRPVLVDSGGDPLAKQPVSNDSPYPPPEAPARQISAAVQTHLDAARRFFEACPVSTHLRLSVAPLVLSCEDLLAEGDHAVLGAVPGSERPSGFTVNVFNRVKQRLQEKASKRRRKNLVPGIDGAPARPLYVNNLNSQRMHCCYRTLYGKGENEGELEHTDIVPEQRGSGVSLPGSVDVAQAFSVATSVDMQHLDLGPSHFFGLSSLTEMPVLSHINLNHNRLGDTGIALLFKGLVDTSCSVVHISIASNDIGDEGAACIATNLGNLPRLTSLELCDNFIQEKGSIALAESIGGVAPPDDPESDDVAPVGPLAVLSIDLRGNRSRELGARRWAEVICAHPDLKFLCLAQNELGRLTKENFLDLACALMASPTLSVLDLQDNFPQPTGPKDKGGVVEMGPPPPEVIEELLADLPPGEFDPTEVKRAVFIRRHRGGGPAPEKKGRQPQQGQQGQHRHAHSGQPTPSGSPMPAPA